MLWHGDDAARAAVDHRDRTAPAALAGDAPVAQAVDGGSFAEPHLFDAGDGGGFGGLHLHPVHEAGIVDPAALDIGLGSDLERTGVGARRQHHRRHRQVVLAGEVEVALVVRRAAKDGPGAVVHQHEVGDPHRHAPFRVERMDDAQTGVEAQLLRRLDLGFRGAALAAFLNERGDARIGRRQLLGQRMVGRKSDEAGAEQGVRPRGVDGDAVMALRRLAGEREGQAQALGSPDPVLLHQPHLVGPTIQGLQPVQQLVGVVGDAHRPLHQLSPFDHRVRAPAAAVDHLLVGQHRHVDRVPVDQRLAPIDQPLCEQPQEPGLLLAVVAGIAGGELARPVDRQAQPLQLLAHGVDVGVGPLGRIDAPLGGGVLGRQAERVPPHRVQHVEAARPFEARHHIAHRIVAGMADVEAPRRIGEHLHHVVLGLG